MFFFQFFNVNLFFRETETECEWVRGRDRGRHRIWSRLQALSCQHRTQCGARTQSCEIMTWAEVGQLTNWAQVLLMFVYFWDRVRAPVGEGREREGGRHRIWSRLQALSCQRRAQRGVQTHELWDHDLSRSQTPNRLNHPATLDF